MPSHKSFSGAGPRRSEDRIRDIQAAIDGYRNADRQELERPRYLAEAPLDVGPMIDDAMADNYAPSPMPAAGDMMTELGPPPSVDSASAAMGFNDMNRRLAQSAALRQYHRGAYKAPDTFVE